MFVFLTFHKAPPPIACQSAFPPLAASSQASPRFDFGVPVAFGGGGPPPPLPQPSSSAAKRDERPKAAGEAATPDAKRAQAAPADGDECMGVRSSSPPRDFAREEAALLREASVSTQIATETRALVMQGRVGRGRGRGGGSRDERDAKTRDDKPP